MNADRINRSITLSFSFDPSVIQIEENSLQPRPNWEIVGTPLVDNVTGYVEITLQRVHGPHLASQFENDEDLLSVSINVVGENGARTAFTFERATIDDTLDAISHVENGSITVSDIPCEPRWKPPSFIGETSICLQWFTNCESNITGYRLNLISSKGDIIFSKDLTDEETSCSVNGLSGAEDFLATLNALSNTGISATSEMKITTKIGPTTKQSQALFIISRDWNPSGTPIQRYGIEALIPIAGDVNEDESIDSNDLYEVFKLVK